MAYISFHSRDIEKIDCSISRYNDTFWLKLEVKNKDNHILDEITFAGAGEGCTLVWSASGWIVSGFNTDKQVLKLARDIIRTLTESLNAINE